MPGDFNLSTSGYYITDVDGFPIKQAILDSKDCGEGNIWEVLESSRTNAIRDLKVDLNAALRSRFEDSAKGFNGKIGKVSHTSVHLNVNTTVGMQLKPQTVKDGKYVLKSVYLGVDESKAVSVTISSNDLDFTPITFIVNSIANRFVKHTFQTLVGGSMVDTPIELPLFSDFVDEVKYNITYSPTTESPLNNKLFCCSGKAFIGHADAQGINTDTFLDNDTYSSDYGYGVAIEGFFDCNKTNWICSISEMGGYDFIDVIARCLQFKAAAYLISKVLKSDRINSYTLLSHEELEGNRIELLSNYNEYIAWIATNLPHNFSSCWKCKSNYSIGSLLV